MKTAITPRNEGFATVNLPHPVRGLIIKRYDSEIRTNTGVLVVGGNACRSPRSDASAPASGTSAARRCRAAEFRRRAEAVCRPPPPQSCGRGGDPGKSPRRNARRDDPEKLKRFLYAAWQKRHARYVLLVGDATVLPVRYMVLDRVTPAAFDTAFYPSDLYYADVARADGSFDDWNGRKDGYHGRYFGEVHGEKNKHDAINFDKVHYVPTLAVGRWPVSTPQEATTLVEKTIAFEERIASGKSGRPRLVWSTTKALLTPATGWIEWRRTCPRTG